MTIINTTLKNILVNHAIDILENNFCYETEGINKFTYAFHILFQDYLKDMRNQNKGYWDNILYEVHADKKKSAYFTGMLVGYQIMKTLQVALEFGDQEILHFEQLFVKKVNQPIEKQAFERKDY